MFKVQRIFFFFFHKQKIVGTVSLFFSFFYGAILFPFAHSYFIYDTNTLFELRRRLRLEDENESGPMVLKTS